MFLNRDPYRSTSTRLRFPVWEVGKQSSGDRKLAGIEVDNELLCSCGTIAITQPPKDEDTRRHHSSSPTRGSSAGRARLVRNYSD